MRIGINLATRPFFNLVPALRRLRIAMGALALIAILLGLGLYAMDTTAKQARQSAQIVDAQIARVENERRSYEARMKQPDNAAVLAQAENLNRLFDTKAFSWTLAIEDLERVLPSGIQVTTLEPTRDDKDGHITLRVRVLGPRDRAIELVQNLEHSRRFLRPRIVGESAEAAGGPNQRVEPVSASNRVNFDVLADYNPAAPAEQHTAAAKPSPEEHASSATPAHLAQTGGTHRPPYTGIKGARR